MTFRWMVAMTLIAAMCVSGSPACAAPLGAKVIIQAAQAQTQEEPPEVSITATGIDIAFVWGTGGMLSWRDATETAYSVITIENLDDSPVTATVTLTSSALPRGVKAMGLSLAQGGGMSETCVAAHIEPGGKGKVYLNIVTKMDGTTDGTVTGGVDYTVAVEREA